MKKSRILRKLDKRLDNKKISNIMAKYIAIQAKKNIKSGKDANYKKFKKRKTKRKNKILYDTGDLYKSIKYKKNNISLLLYGIFNQYGTSRGIDSRKFIPMNKTKQFEVIKKRILKGLLK